MRAEISNRIWIPRQEIPDGAEQAVLKLAEQANPVYLRATRMRRRPPEGTPAVIRMHREWRDWISLPRGVLGKLEALAAAHFSPLEIQDSMADGPALSREPDPCLRPMQQRAIDAIRRHHQGTIRMPTGSGKSRVVLAACRELGIRGVVVVFGVGLARKWVREAVEYFGDEADVGMIGDGEFSLGSRLTVAVEASLRDPRRRAALIEHGAGMAVLDEAQFGAANTYLDLFDFLPFRRRYALSADERRADGLEFVTRWVFGPVILDESYETAVREGIVVPVTVRLIPTDAESSFYCEDGGHDFGRMVRELEADLDRHQLLLDTVHEIVRAEHVPLVVFAHHRDHVEQVAGELGAGILLGGKKSSREFEATRAGLADGSIPIAVGTYKAFGTGHDVPAITAVLMSTPVGKKAKQFFRQVRGRAVRLGKERGYVYALWDRNILPSLGQHLHLWNGGDVEVRDLAGWRKVTLRELRDMVP